MSAFQRTLPTQLPQPKSEVSSWLAPPLPATFDPTAPFSLPQVPHPHPGAPASSPALRLCLQHPYLPRAGPPGRDLRSKATQARPPRRSALPTAQPRLRPPPPCGTRSLCFLADSFFRRLRALAGRRSFRAELGWPPGTDAGLRGRASPGPALGQRPQDLGRCRRLRRSSVSPGPSRRDFWRSSRFPRPPEAALRAAPCSLARAVTAPGHGLLTLPSPRAQGQDVLPGVVTGVATSLPAAAPRPANQVLQLLSPCTRLPSALPGRIGEGGVSGCWGLTQERKIRVARTQGGGQASE